MQTNPDQDQVFQQTSNCPSSKMTCPSTCTHQLDNSLVSVLIYQMIVFDLRNYNKNKNSNIGLTSCCEHKHMS